MKIAPLRNSTVVIEFDHCLVTRMQLSERRQQEALEETLLIPDDGEPPHFGVF